MRITGIKENQISCQKTSTQVHGSQVHYLDKRFNSPVICVQVDAFGSVGTWIVIGTEYDFLFTESA
jgi:hypothetical protein